MRTISIATTPRTQTSFSPTPSPTAISSGAQGLPWHSPVPYLFGGLAAMLGLIAFGLLILACSYWKLARRQGNRQGRDLENGADEKDGDSASKRSVQVYEEKVVGIMAGDDRPRFLATPVLAKIVSLDDGIGKDVSKKGNSKNENSDKKTEKEMGNHDQIADQQESIGDTETQANPEHDPL